MCYLATSTVLHFTPASHHLWAPASCPFLSHLPYLSRPLFSRAPASCPPPPPPHIRNIWNEPYIELGIWSQVSYDPSSYKGNFSNCVEKPEKVRSSTGFEPVTSRCWCDALTNWFLSSCCQICVTNKLRRLQQKRCLSYHTTIKTCMRVFYFYDEK